MIPILYPSNATAFTNNGFGYLSDCIDCSVNEERNGSYELELTYPITGIHYSDITISCIIKAPNYKGAEGQLFRIYKISKPISGKVSVYAEHISYQLSQIPVMPFDTKGASTSAAQMFNLMKTNAAETCPFTFSSDTSGVSTLVKLEIPTPFRSCIGGIDGSMLDHFHGELEWNNYEVKLHKNRGANHGVIVRYGKNLVDVNQEENIENTVTGICPYWKGQDANGNDKVVTYSGKAVYCDKVDNFPYKRTLVYDFSSYFENPPTSDQLKKAAQDYIEDNKIGVPDVDIKMKFIDLSDMEEYRHLASSETVKLCDTITVVYEKLGVEATAKIIKVQYDVLKERYSSIEIGNATPTSLVKTINTMVNNVAENSVNSSYVLDAINKATSSITGNKGGYVIMHDSDGDSKPDEILIMDTMDIATALNVWRWNQGGLGFSGDGYNGPYKVAMTMDGFISMAKTYVRTNTEENVATIATGWKNSANVVIPMDGYYLVRADFRNNGGISSTDHYSLSRFRGRLRNGNEYLGYCGVSSYSGHPVWYDGSADEIVWFGPLNEGDHLYCDIEGSAAGAYTRVRIDALRIG